MSTYQEQKAWVGDEAVRNEPLPSPASHRRELVRRLYGAALRDALHAGVRVTGALRHYTDLMDQLDLVPVAVHDANYYQVHGICMCPSCRYCREQDERAREERGSAEQAQLEEPNRNSAVTERNFFGESVPMTDWSKLKHE